MSLLRRDEAGFSRARRARRLRDRARRQLGSSARFMIEELESRVLLSASSGPPAVTFFTLDLPLQTAAISALAEPSFPIRQLSTTEGEITHGISEAVSAGMNYVHLHLPMQPDPPMFVLLEPPMLAGDQPASFAVESGSAPLLHYGQLAPPLATEGADFSSDFGATTTATAYPGHVSPASAPSNGTVWVNYTSAANDPAPSAGPSVGPNSPVIADLRRAEVAGTLGPGQTTMTFEIPLGPQTQSLGLSVRQTGGDADTAPVFGQMDLVNPTGTTMAQFGPAAGPGASVLQGMTVQVHNATSGSNILIQVTTSEPFLGGVSSSSATGSASTAAPSQASNGNVSFVLDVQRQDATNNAQASGQAVQGPVSVGTLVIAPTPQGGSSVSSSTWTAPAEEDDESAPAAQASTTAVASAASATSEPLSESPESFNVRVSTGPFASRSASPLGPTLASIDAEATQQVDRHERAMSQEIEGLEPADTEQSTAWRSAGTDQELSSQPENQPGSSGFTGPVRAVVDVPGSGGFPMMVTSPPGRGQQSQIGDLWATLPSFADSASSVSSSARPEISVREGPLTSAAPSHSSSDSTNSPDYVKAACGLAFGLVMTSRPLFPDLIARLARRIPKWLVALRARSARAASPSQRRRSPRPITMWLRGLFVPR